MKTARLLSALLLLTPLACQAQPDTSEADADAVADAQAAVRAAITDAQAAADEAADAATGPTDPEADALFAARADDYIDLFDGETLDGWTPVNGQATYAVEDGHIVGRCNPGTRLNTFLRTDATFSDFELRLDLKLDEPGNSGVMVRAHQREPGDGAPDGRVYGYQIETDPSDRAWSGGLYDESRRGWLHPLEGDDFADARAALNLDGWNTYVIRMEGRRIRSWVNGVPCTDYTETDDANFDAEGFIGLQVHQGQQGVIRWRNVQLLDLTSDDDTPAPVNE